ncbi:tetratricopeptide repeat protein [Undibacterium sp. Xuan67W]|uniref:tetratricopeptide repeat protein n=1 Tax=Undibacterium sp. Xuan67W TaxID=3413057 RepID=UPI003BF12A71
MQFPKPEHSRIALLLIALSLIGGTGCITSSLIDSARQKEAQQKYADQQRKIIDSYKADAAKGDLLAITRLGLEYTGGSSVTRQDIPAGLALLEQAAEKKYAVAEYALGSLLLTGKDGYRWNTLLPEQLPRQPDRGLSLLKQSATHACIVSLASGGNAGAVTAYELSKLYREGRGIEKDLNQADLWLARSIIHCQHPNAYVIKSIFPIPKSAPAQAQIDVMSWILMMPADNATAKKVTTDLQPLMSADDWQKAQRQMARLRQVAIDSEQQIPAPPQANKP